MGSISVRTALARLSVAQFDLLSLIVKYPGGVKAYPNERRTVKALKRRGLVRIAGDYVIATAEGHAEIK
jgi:hypothetical protein